MTPYYFNHRAHIATSNWQRRSFLSAWWRIGARDSHWVPPYYPALKRALTSQTNDYLAAMRPIFVHTEALARDFNPYAANPQQQTFVTPVSFEIPLAATAVLQPRGAGATAYLGLLQCGNDRQSLEHLLEKLVEPLRANGRRRLLGPTGLSPHLGTGVLQDHWDQIPPWHTPYHPPYLAELLDGVLHPLERSRLYHLAVDAPLPPVPAAAEIIPLEPARLATDLLPLLVAACEPHKHFPLPDASEAAFLLRWLDAGTLRGWLALVDGETAGFVLLQPDFADAMRRAGGGRRLWQRVWLALLENRAVRRGRLLYGAVLPPWRGRGIGRQLLYQALLTAQEQGWHTLTIGPLPERATAVSFLKRQGAHPHQSYRLYEWTF